MDRIKGINPDIVVSDVLMPLLDGIELCKRIKSDVTTGHIPVILLTSKEGMEYELTGLKHGADDYVSKPFSVEKLLTRVHNLIENKNRLSKRYGQPIIKDRTTVGLNGKDREFFCTITQVMNEHISEIEFDNIAFSRVLDMSLTKFYRSVKRITGKTPTELLRDHRLKKASEALEVEDTSISELCERYGFRSRAYFHKCFKELHGMTPSEYRDVRFNKESV